MLVAGGVFREVGEDEVAGYFEIMATEAAWVSKIR